MLASSRGGARLGSSVFGVVAMLAVLVAARVALLALVDASSFPAHSSRYVYPFVSLYGCTMLLLADAGARARRRMRSGG